MIRILPPFWGRKEFEVAIKYLIGEDLSKFNFKKHLEERLNKKFYPYKIILTNSARVALLAILKYLSFPPGTKVAVPSFICPAVIAAILQANCIPNFIDINDDMTMNPIDLENKIDTSTKIVIMPHIYGIVCNIKRIISIAKKYNLILIDDAATCAGLDYHGQTLGTFGDFGLFSMNCKVIYSIMGGGIICKPEDEYALKKLIYESDIEPNSNEVKKLILSTILKRLGHKIKFDKIKTVFKNAIPTINGYIDEVITLCPISDISAAIGLMQLEKMESIIKKRLINSQILITGLKNLTQISIVRGEHGNFFTRFVIKLHGQIPDKIKKSQNQWEEILHFRKFLLKKGIQTFDVYTPAHLLLKTKEHLPCTEDIWKRSIVIPNNPLYSKKHMQFIVKKIRKYFNKGH